MNTEQAKVLLQRYRMGLCTSEEIAAIEEWYDSMVEKSDVEWTESEKTAFEYLLKRSILTAIHKSEPAVISLANKKRFSYLRWVAVAATIILAFGAGGYFWLFTKKPAGIATTEKTVPHMQNDALPGTNQPVLTLANGKQVVLDSIKSGTLALEENASVVKLADGQITYQPVPSPASQVTYNTLTVPKGSNIVQLTLADGSKIWLDAASSIVYPTAFTGKERKVEITGQVYFEIAKNPAIPFIVKKLHGDAEVRVLGTHFNINAYDDEAVTTITLLEGSVQVTKGKNNRLLSPGQQIQINSMDNMALKENADVDAVMAWKNGMFQFNNAGLPDVLRQLARWYDVDIVYKGKVPEREFQGKMERNLKLSQVLRILEKNQVNFKIEEKKLIVQ